jgi:ABC-type sugar transport system ATPase subunit
VFVHLAKGEHRKPEYSKVNAQALVPTLELDDGTSLPLGTMARDTAGRQVIFGIRPEDIHHPMDRRDAPDHQKAKVTVEVVEPLGSEQFVYLRSGNQEFTSRMSSRAQLAAGNNVDVVFDTEKMHVFDKQTEMALA